MASEKTYTIPLYPKTLKTRRHKRANRAVSAVRQFMEKHSKGYRVRLGMHLNEKLWEQGMRNVARRVRVRAETDGKAVTVELIGAPREVKKKEPEKKAVTPAEKIAEKMRELKPKKESPTKSSAEVREIKTETPAKTNKKAAANKKDSTAKTPETVTEKSGKPEAPDSKTAAEPAKPVEKKQPEKAAPGSK
jgi:large subunit ribosomal protein L31e